MFFFRNGYCPNAKIVNEDFEAREMIPTIKYQEILDKLRDDPDYWIRDGQPLRVTMCGLLFARPQVSFAMEEVFKDLGYLDSRLGPRFHLFTAGCLRRGMPNENCPDFRPIGADPDWYYSDHAFDQLRREIETETSWKYRDGVELLLFNAFRNQHTGSVSLNYHSAIAIDLQNRKQFRPTETVANLIGQIANYCNHYDSDDPTWGFSDKVAIQVGRTTLWNLFVGLFTDDVRNDANMARMFITQDLSKK